MRRIFHLWLLTGVTTVVALEFRSISLEYVCGKHKFVNLTAQSRIQSSSPYECAAECSQAVNCTGLNYHSVSRQCDLFLEGLLDPCWNASDSPGGHFMATPEVEVCYNGGTPKGDGKTCYCPGSWIGNFCEKYAKDCTQLYDEGKRVAGSAYAIFNVWPDDAGQPIEVLCQLEYGGYIIMQSNKDRVGCQADFNRTWQQYKQGFGTVERHCDFWLGLENLNHVTSQSTSYTLVMSITTSVADAEGDTFSQGQYRDFLIQSESDHYRMSYSSYSPSADTPSGDSFAGTAPKVQLNGMYFSTWDMDNDQSDVNCAEQEGGGWWYCACAVGNGNTDPPRWDEDRLPYTVTGIEMKLKHKGTYLTGINHESRTYIGPP